ncbi:MAG: leucyl/phenylalanyl-tRNA--protein transferase [Muribaculaceae bacterium]|nr:leucyl/phenylalanyl-tRNA--protein transferase [Muribaculaceae bacterium]
MVFELFDDSLEFPDPRHGEPDGLFAIGGELSAERLLMAYSMGAFPWFSFRDTEQPFWYCPMERFVIFPEEIHISHSSRNLLNKGVYRCTINRAFDRVIEGCAEKRIDLEGAWLGEKMMAAYKRLHNLGFAISVEVWNGDSLAGGLYGVSIGSAFFGESMFSREPGASKIALIHLARTMERNGGSLIDCQFETPHLKTMGGRFIDYDDYLRIIRKPTWLKDKTV